jgi:hypothetical protein
MGSGNTSESTEGIGAAALEADLSDGYVLVPPKNPMGDRNKATTATANSEETSRVKRPPSGKLKHSNPI